MALTHQVPHLCTVKLFNIVQTQFVCQNQPIKGVVSSWLLACQPSLTWLLSMSPWFTSTRHRPAASRIFYGDNQNQHSAEIVCLSLVSPLLFCGLSLSLQGGRNLWLSILWHGQTTPILFLRCCHEILLPVQMRFPGRFSPQKITLKQKQEIVESMVIFACNLNRSRISSPIQVCL